MWHFQKCFIILANDVAEKLTSPSVKKTDIAKKNLQNITESN